MRKILLILICLVCVPVNAGMPVISQEEQGKINATNRNFQETENMGGKHLKPKRLTAQHITGVWQRIYYNELTSTADSVTISDLNGNTDIEYQINLRIKRVAAAGNGNVGIYFNSDNTGTNYYYNSVDFSETSISAGTGTGDFMKVLRIAYNNDYGTSFIHLFAKSGARRFLVSHSAEYYISGSVSYNYMYYSYWLNTSDNITSMTLASDTSNLFGAGTIIEVFARH